MSNLLHLSLTNVPVYDTEFELSSKSITEVRLKSAKLNTIPDLPFPNDREIRHDNLLTRYEEWSEGQLYVDSTDNYNIISPGADSYYRLHVDTTLERITMTLTPPLRE